MSNEDARFDRALQALAADPAYGIRRDDAGATVIAAFPNPHGNHFHIGGRVVAMAHALGLWNDAVWVALARKGLAVAETGVRAITDAGLAYETGLADRIAIGADH